MKESNEDKILRSTFKTVELDKPGHNFTSNVMNKVHDIAATKLETKSLKIFGAKFWIIIFLFVALAAVLVILSLTGMQPESAINELLPSIDNGQVNEGYRSVLNEINRVPVSVAAILIASSTLIFFERFLSKRKIHS